MKNKKVLVVDDEPEILELLKNRLEQHQFEVITVSDANLAIEKLQEVIPDLFILDILMPSFWGIDKYGASLCEVLKTQDEYKSIPIIVISALGRNLTPVIEEMIKQADAYFPKPFQAEVLIKKANELVSK